MSTLFQEHCQRWQHGCGSDLCNGARHIVLSRGQVPCEVLFTGEGPGNCLTGDTLIDTAYRDKSLYPDGIPIKDLVGCSNFYVYSYDTELEKVAVGNVKRVWCTGVKKVYEVGFFWWGAPPDGKGGRHKYFGSIKVTDNHPFLLKSGEYQSIQGGLTLGSRLQPFYRWTSKYPRIGTYYASTKNEAILLMEHKLGRPLVNGEQVHHHDRNKWNDTWDNLVLMDIAEHARLHGLEDNAMFNPIHRATHRKVMDSEEYRSNLSNKMKEVLADPKIYAERLEQIASCKHKIANTVQKKFDEDPGYYYRYLKGRVFRNGKKMSESRIKFLFEQRFPGVPYPLSKDNHEVYSIKPVGMAAVYDMEVEKYHNFVANGIVVHNSEDMLGRPFVGVSGQLLDHIIKRAVPSPVRVAFTNLVGCIPRVGGEGEDRRKSCPPLPEEISQCAPRLREFVAICNPKLIVCVGGSARDALDPKYSGGVKFDRQIPMVDIQHPAYMLRLNVTMKGLAVQRAVVVIQNAVEDFVLGKGLEK